jgi:hypothetical protein
VLIPARSSDGAPEFFARLLDILAPGDSYLVAMLEAYFDESGSHDGSPVLCVAGYLFEKEGAKTLDSKWRQVLERFSLPFFHMVDCAHGAEPFDKLSKDERIAVEKEMIALIRSHTIFGFAVGVDEKEYNNLFRTDNPFGTAYSYCCWTCLTAIHNWIARRAYMNHEIAYFFEAGHRDQGEANIVMQKIFNDPNLRREYRYGAHAFVAKEKVCAIQTADMLAWQHATHIKRKLRGQEEPRKDLIALIEDQPVECKFIHREAILNMRAQVSALYSGRQVISGIFGNHTFASMS